MIVDLGFPVEMEEKKGRVDGRSRGKDTEDGSKGEQGGFVGLMEEGVSPEGLGGFVGDEEEEGERQIGQGAPTRVSVGAKAIDGGREEGFSGRCGRGGSLGEGDGGGGWKLTVEGSMAEVEADQRSWNRGGEVPPETRKIGARVGLTGDGEGDLGLALAAAVERGHGTGGAPAWRLAEGRPTEGGSR